MTGIRLRWQSSPALSASQTIGILLIAAISLGAALAPSIAPHGPGEQFADRAYAPPMPIRIRASSGFRAPFVHPLILEDRLMRAYRADTSRPVPVRWFRNGRLMSIDAADGPLLLFGGDTLGRDVLARLVHGARLSLGVTACGVLGALVVGMLAGGLAGTWGGWPDALLMAVADFLLVLPAAYLVLVLRGVLPLVLPTAQVFVLMAGLFTVAAWPHVARGVRAIVAAERQREYAEAARAAGAGRFRLLLALLPAARGFLAVEVVLLVPALLAAEATVSYLGLGFAEPHASWGTLLREAADTRVMAEAPWLLVPAAAMFLVALGAYLAGRTRASGSVLLLSAAATGPTSAARRAA